jgi:hypothetical protein
VASPGLQGCNVTNHEQFVADFVDGRPQGTVRWCDTAPEFELMKVTISRRLAFRHSLSYKECSRRLVKMSRRTRLGA